jgi:hypothetical protein
LSGFVSHELSAFFTLVGNDADNLWFLRFITSVDELTKLSRLRLSTSLKIPGVGRKYAGDISAWQSHASFSHEVGWVGEMIIDDARRILALKDDIKVLELRCKTLMQESQAAPLIDSIPGFAVICASELAGEIGTIDRLASERSLALYLGMANLDNCSWKLMIICVIIVSQIELEPTTHTI